MNVDKIEKENAKFMDKIIKMYNIDKTPMGDQYLKYKKRAVTYITHQDLLNRSRNDNYKLYITDKIKIKLRKIENNIIFLERKLRRMVDKFNIKIINIKNKIKGFLKIFKFRRK